MKRPGFVSDALEVPSGKVFFLVGSLFACSLPRLLAAAPARCRACRVRCRAYRARYEPPWVEALPPVCFLTKPSWAPWHERGGPGAGGPGTSGRNNTPPRGALWERIYFGSLLIIFVFFICVISKSYFRLISDILIVWGGHWLLVIRS